MRATVHQLVRIALAGLLVTTTSACLISIGGCSSEEAAHFNDVEHYGGAELVPEDDRLGSCGASFSTTEDPDLVIEHYRSRLEAAGWTIDPPLPSPPPPPEGGVEIQSVWLSAHKGTIGYGVSAEILGGPETVFVIHVGDSG
ncbi:MAG: hypothetical protein M3R49_03245 [Chloroflexota bacterium]|nr:hypothetical protein [Chloroflexota bacterium]